MMKRSIFLAVLLALLNGVAAWPQADWQGDVTKHFPITIPPFKGKRMTMMQMPPWKGKPAIENYTFFLNRADAKEAFPFYKAHLEKVGFKTEATKKITDDQVRADLFWAQKGWTGVVLATPYPNQDKVSFTITISAR